VEASCEEIAVPQVADWRELNKQSLTAELGACYEQLCNALNAAGVEVPEKTLPVRSLGAPELTARPATPTTLDELCATFQLSPFARQLLLLCVGLELDPRFATLFAAANGDPGRAFPTFGFALALLPEPEWSALMPSMPLRRWRLIEVGPGSSLMQSPLRIDERLLHYLVGFDHLDERFAGLLSPVARTTPLVPSHQVLVEGITSIWAERERKTMLPVVQLCGDDRASKRDLAAHACQQIGLTLWSIGGDLLPSTAADLEAMVRLWTREAALSQGALLIDASDLDTADAVHALAALRLAERVTGVVIFMSRERRQSLQRPFVTIDVQKPSSSEQQAMWRSSLGDPGSRLNGQITRLTAQFNLNAQAITELSASVLGSASAEQLEPALWEACRAYARPRLDDLAQRLDTPAGWQDLILPEAQFRVLREIAAHVRQRARVYDEWGFAGRGARGLGISALFAGVSGTGKTLAAEVLANVLRLDLYRIDLSAVVSKYIGETEKNLRRIFDVAEESGAILLFDEADALFGKRSEVKDSHDRYANIEVSYLLQRMESYRGLAILTTNLKHALDTAFLRRIRFVIQFPFPDEPQRAAIWRRMFPQQTPREGLDYDRLAQLHVPGGNIRNIALRAAFLAADTPEPVQMRHLLDAARSEYAKLEKPLPETEVAGWVLR